MGDELKWLLKKGVGILKIIHGIGLQMIGIHLEGCKTTQSLPTCSYQNRKGWVAKKGA